jgi:hypothetical protein
MRRSVPGCSVRASGAVQQGLRDTGSLVADVSGPETDRTTGDPFIEAAEFLRPGHPQPFQLLRVEAES